MYVLSSFCYFAQAACPVCISGMGVMVIVAKRLGMNLVSLGVLVGALSYSVLEMFTNKITRNRWNQTIIKLVLFSVILYTLTLNSGDIILIGSYYIDRIVFGGIIGAMLFKCSLFINELIKRRNGRVFFRFQKVFIVLSVLMVSSTLIHFLEL